MTEIIKKFSGAVITSGEMNLRELVASYIKEKGYGANLSGANLRGANLRDANLSGANLSGADLRDANLSGANLSGADLRDANLSGANLSGANLRDADLRDANLRDANLSGANLRDANLCGTKIKSCAVYTGLYKYIAIPFISVDGTEYIKLGCYVQTAKEWKKDFWNNPNEFPNNGDMGSKLRWMAYKTCLQWLKLNREVGNGKD